MSKKQLIIASSIFIILLIILLIVNKKEEGDWRKGEFANKRSLITKLDVNKIAKIAIHDSKNNVELAIKNNKWVVFNRDDFSANFAKIRNFILSVNNLKIAQKLDLKRSSFKDIKVIAPSEGSGKNSGTVVEFYDIAGDSLLSLILGDFHYEKKRDHNPFVEPDKNGRYVMVAGGEPVLTNTTLENISPIASEWLNQSIIKLSPLKALSRISNIGTIEWKVFRNSEKERYALFNLKKNQQANLKKIYIAMSTLENFRFIDVIPLNFKAKRFNFKNAINFTVDLFSGVIFKMEMIKKDKRIYTKLAILSSLPSQRVVDVKETPEKKAKLDKEFAIAKDRVFQLLREYDFINKWIYEISPSEVEKFLLNKDDFLTQQSNTMF